MDKYDIEMLLEQRGKLEIVVDSHSERLNALPTLSNGLVSDEVRDTDYYKFHKREYDKHFKHLQEFNSRLTNQTKREMSKYKSRNV